MSSEVFRFVNLRPARVTDSDDNTVVFYHSRRGTTFYRELQALKASGRPRQAFEERAAAYLNSENYALGGTPLPVRLDLFAEWLSKQGPRVPVSAIQDQLKQQLGTSLPDLLSAEGFPETRNRIPDSTVASAILPTLRRDSRGVLIRLMRVLGLLEGFQRWPADTVNVGKALSAVLLLPEDVFPLPPAENPHDKRVKEEAEKNLKRYQDAAKKIEDLAHKLGRLQHAATEIATAYAADTNDARRAYSTTELAQHAATPVEGGGVVIAGGQRSVMSPVLTTQRATSLSGPTKDILNEMTISTEFVDVHHTVTGVEQEVAAISEKLFNGRSFTTLVRIGNVFVPADKYTVEGMTGSDKVPGACMQGAPESPVVTTPTVPDTQPSSIRPIGIADLLQVRQKIKRYVPGEIAHIENIMAGESKERTHRQSTRIVETRLLETETTKEESRDLQTAERFELQQEVSQVIREESSREVGISISASYGPFAEGTANLNFARSESQEDSNKNATRYSREVTDKAVRRTQERVLERRTVTTEREFEETSKHALNNADGDGHIVAIYRWVDKLYEAQVISYGLRMMFEFVIPEPAALYRHALTLTPREGTSVQRPDPPGYCLLNTETFVSLTPNDLNEANYLFWVSKYGVSGVAPPPPRFKTIGTALNEEATENDSTVTIANAELQVPAGYRAVRSWVSGQVAVFAVALPALQPFLTFHIGRTHVPVHGSGPMNGEDGIIPVAGHGYRVAFFAATIEVLCVRTKEPYEAWQIETYNAIINAYNDKKSQFDAEMARLAAQAEGTIIGRRPEINRDIERTELKRAAISMLTAQHYDDFDAMRRGVPLYGYPQMDLNEAQAEGSYIQFFEQALEWINATYRFYPYFWGRKDEWPKSLRLDDADPLFARFLQAGAARIQIPVRPGYDSAVVSLLTGKKPWEEEGEFDIEGSLYISMVDEIREEQLGAFTKGVGTISVQQGQAKVDGVGTAFDEKLHTDRDISIQNATYKVKEVLSATELLLDAPYRGASEQGLPYSFGARLVGDPWEVRIPTNLIYLQEGSELPNLATE